jgi:L-fuculokinase
MKVIAIFDIGKTNKKYFLFDELYNELLHEYISFAEITDEDGFPCDDLAAITNWIEEKLKALKTSPDLELTAVNFSTYGATLVHLNQNLQPVTALYNYTKPYPPELWEKFNATYNSANQWSLATASPALGMLNAGLQLYWLKYAKPDYFQKIQYTLFFPQYLSYLLTGKLVTDYTGLGCHTGMWHFEKNDYHRWMYDEHLVEKMPPLQLPQTHDAAGDKFKVGLGIHDSSSALLAYKTVASDPYILLSTGTWSICLNPFAAGVLNEAELAGDCLMFMQPNGKPVIASRLFIGNEYSQWVKQLTAYFSVAEHHHQQVKFDGEIYADMSKRFDSAEIFLHRHIPLAVFTNFEEGYHLLIYSLAVAQVKKIWLAIKGSSVRKIYVDGGFAHNLVFIRALETEMPDFEFIPSEMPIGSAKGAALALQL